MNEYAFNRTFNAMQEAYDNMQPPDDYDDDYDEDYDEEEDEDEEDYDSYLESLEEEAYERAWAQYDPYKSP